jgi:folate-binding protein YgfZ
LISRLSTNDLLSLMPGQGAGTVLTTKKGRIVDLVLIIVRPDGLLLLCSPSGRRRVMEYVDFYTFSEDAVLEDCTEVTGLIGVHGPKAAQILQRVGLDVSFFDRYDSEDVQIADEWMTVLRTDALGLPGYEFIVAMDRMAAMFEILLDAGAIPVGDEAVETVRILQGVPGPDNELTEEHNPLEARMKSYVSYSKGCYVGQEVIARLTTYDKVQRYLMSVRLDGEARPGDILAVGGQVMGKLASVAPHPVDGGRPALAYVKRSAAKTGQILTVADSNVVAQLSDTPFALLLEMVASTG